MSKAHRNAITLRYINEHSRHIHITHDHVPINIKLIPIVVVQLFSLVFLLPSMRFHTNIRPLSAKPFTARSRRFTARLASTVYNGKQVFGFSVPKFITKS